LIGGEFSEFNGVPCNNIARLNSDGTVDPSFNSGTGVFGTVLSCVEQSDGKLIVSGAFSDYNGTPTNGIIRLNTDGTIDPSYNVGTGFDGYVYATVLLPNSKLLAVGQFTNYSGSNCNGIVRLNVDGTIDNTFSSGSGIGNVGFPSVYSLTVQADNKLLIGGDFTSYNGTSRNGVARLNANGSLDNTFNPLVVNDDNSPIQVYSLNYQPDGNVIIGGNYNVLNGTPLNYFGRLTSTGILDTTFNYALGACGLEFSMVSTTAIQTNDKIIIGGYFKKYNGVARNSIARLNVDGTLDLSFNPGTGFDNIVSTCVLQNDQKILVGGLFSTFNGSSRNCITRLNANGSIDMTFNVGTGFSGSSTNMVNDILVQPNGKIIIVGEFTFYNGVSSNNIVRLNANGTIDNTFNQGTGFDNPVSSIAIQADGKILIGGNFSSYNGTACNKVIRLNSNGTIDPTFNVNGIQSLGINRIIIQQDQKIILGGNNITINGTDVFNLCRINEDGSFDNSFNIIIGNYSTINDLLLLQNGKIIVATNDLVCFNNDGSYDSNFANFYFQGPHYSLSQISDGRFILGGDFSANTNMPYNGVLRLLNCNLNWNVETACDTFTWPLNGQTYTATGIYQDTLSNGVGCDSIYTLNLTINYSNVYTQTETACDSFLWTVNGQTYSLSGIYQDTLTNISGCDSVLVLDLTIIPTLPLTIANTFSLPSDANSCIGELAVSVSGNADFELNVDYGAQIMNTSAYSLINNLCPGIHDLLVTDNCGDSLTSQFVIPIDSNYIFNNPFIDSIAVDSLGSTITNCDIYYNQIDSAYIDSIWASGNTVNVIWNIVDANGSNFDTTSYVLNNGNGVYWLQLSIFCPTKAIGDYFTVSEAIYFNNGAISLADLAESEIRFLLYPNPTNDKVTLFFDSNNARVKLYDALGKIILQSDIKSGSEISLKNLQTGIYMFVLSTEKGIITEKIIKE
jgi:uncharacterized delta-60 repeat protein